MPKKSSETTEDLGHNEDPEKSIKPPKGEKSKSLKGDKKKKKKSKDSVSKPESSATLLSTDSKAKKKKIKNSKSPGEEKEKKKLKKGKRKHTAEGAIQENGGKMVEGEHPEQQQQQQPQEKQRLQPQTPALEVPQSISHEQISLNDDTLNEPIGGSAAAPSLEDDIIEDDEDMMENSQIFDTGPPIGEIVADASEEDNVSDIGDAVPDGDPIAEVIDGVEIIYNPDDTDICFDDRHHPGTKDWIIVIRDCLNKFEGHDYSPPVYKAIKKKLKGRRFLLRTRRNERTSWREATKPEIIELFGECFNEERRRILEGIADDDDSGVDSSLQNSAAQSDASISVADIVDENPSYINGTNGPLPTPTSAPTPRASNQEADVEHVSIEADANNGNFRLQSPPRRTKSDSVLMGNRQKARLVNHKDYPIKSENTTDHHLLLAMREIEGAEEYARPFDDVALLQQGIAAEEKLHLLLSLSDSSKTVGLKTELDKLEDLAKRMRYASMAPLLDILTKIERHVMDYYQSLAHNNASSSSLQASIQQLTSGMNGYHKTALTKQRSLDIPPTNPQRAIETDPTSDVDTERENSNSHQGARHRRTIPVNSDHGKPEESVNDHAVRSKSSEDISSSHCKSSGYSSANGMNHSAGSLSLDEEFDVEIPNGTHPSTAATEDMHSSSDVEREESRSHEGEEEEDDDDDQDSHNESDYEQPLEDDQETLDDNGISLRNEDFGGSYREMALGGSSNADGLVADSDGEYSAELATEKKCDPHQQYDESYRTEDLGGSYREMALGGSYENSGLEIGSIENEELEGEESGISEQYDDEVGDDEREDNGEVEYDDEGGEEGEEMDEREEEGLEGDMELQDDDGSVENQVLELKPGYDGDDLSSMGRSMPGIYGSDSEDEDDDEYDDVEIDFDEDDLDDDDDDESERSDSSGSTSEESDEKNEKEEKPNPKVEQFFDRLQHFFEVRRKVDERAELMDPSGKLRGLKVKQHSGGILKKNGKYKKEYQQRNLRDKIIHNLDDLYDAAELAQEGLKRLLSQLVGDVKGMDDTSFIVAPMKQRNKAFDKARQEYSDRKPGPPESWLFDIVRGSVVCKSYKQLADVNKWIGKNCHVVTAKNRFQDPVFNGYRDLLFHLSIPYKDDLAHTCEIQVHHRDMKALDEQFGMPKHYEYFRSAFAGPWRTQEQILEDLSMLNKYGEIGGQCMVKLLKSKDPDQLRLFARLCRGQLDEFDRALELYRRVLLLQEATIGDDHEDVADTYLGLGLVLGALGEIDESLLNLEKALAVKESILGTEHLEVAEIYAEIGHMLRQKGEYNGALKKYRDALTVRESNLGNEHFLVISSLQDIGRALRDTGDFKASEGELRRALKIQETVLGDAHPDVAVTRSEIGTTLCQLGDFTRAMEEHRLALTIRETSLGKNHPLTADSHMNIGIVLCQKGDYEVAEWRHRKALRIQEAVKGKDDEGCAVSLSHLGEVLKRKGDYEGAIKGLKRAVKIREQNLGMDHPISAGSHLDLGQVYMKKRKYDQALEEFRKAKVVRETYLGKKHPDTAVAYNAVGNVLSRQEEHEAALVEHKKAIAVYEAALGKSHPKTATGYQHLADALLAKGDRDESLIEHRKALSVRANILSKDHPDTALSCARIGTLLSEKGDLVGALVAYRQALAITVGLCGEDHPESATAHIQVGTVLAAQGDVEDAMEEVQQALEVREATLGKDHPDTARAHGVIGTLYSMLGEFTEAQEKHKKCLSILERKLGKKNPDVKAARQRLMKAVEKKEESIVLGSY